jgi:glycerophosphoryl diester phosphodiesterase
MVAMIGVASILLATLYLELAGLMNLLAKGHIFWWQAMAGSAAKFQRLLLLGLWQFAFYLLLATPFLAVIGIAYWLLWRGRDLNGLIVLKPPVFWWGAGAGVSIAIYAALAYAVRRCLLAVPTILFELTWSKAIAATQLPADARANQHVLSVLAMGRFQSVLAIFVWPMRGLRSGY